VISMRARALVVLLLGSALFLPALGADPVKPDARRKPAEEDRGKLLYERHCAACHGVRAGGDGPATQALVVPVPDLQGQVKADKATIDLVLLGRGPMPAFEPSFRSDDAKKILIYMSKLTTAAPPPPGEEEPPAEAAAAEGDVPEPPEEDAPEAP
jgi:mono/diheme cytochrome c family protein